VVTVSGEAGVGKSRLLYEFQNWIELLPGRVRLYQGQARLETQHIPYVLMRDVFSFRFKIQESDSPQVVREKIEQGIGQAFSDQPSGYGPQRLVIADLLPSGSKLASKSKKIGKRWKKTPTFWGRCWGLTSARAYI
jgi:hypothetical protein